MNTYEVVEACLFGLCLIMPLLTTAILIAIYRVQRSSRKASSPFRHKPPVQFIHSLRARRLDEKKRSRPMCFFGNPEKDSPLPRRVRTCCRPAAYEFHWQCFSQWGRGCEKGQQSRPLLPGVDGIPWLTRPSFFR